MLLPLAIVAQDYTPTEQQAKEYFYKNQEIISSSTYFEEDGPLFDFYSKKNTGDVVITGTEIHKVVGPKLITLYNCSMIFFDNRIQPAAEIESAQKTIMSNYESGFSFQELAERYSDPIHHSEDSMIDAEDLPDCPLRSGLEQHKPKEMFFVEASEYISYLIVINDFPVKRKGIIVQHAVYE
ncbi:MAG: hypothetical protein DI539_01710 [Flavobacterium psychrophilum]|nr:MAG: hypothetical protein DI539_01710 [Flavobacterium psychrophilum]